MAGGSRGSRGAHVGLTWGSRGAHVAHVGLAGSPDPPLTWLTWLTWARRLLLRHTTRLENLPVPALPNGRPTSRSRMLTTSCSFVATPFRAGAHGANANSHILRYPIRHIHQDTSCISDCILVILMYLDEQSRIHVSLCIVICIQCDTKEALKIYVS